MVVDGYHNISLARLFTNMFIELLLITLYSPLIIYVPL